MLGFLMYPAYTLRTLRFRVVQSDIARDALKKQLSYVAEDVVKPFTPCPRSS